MQNQLFRKTSLERISSPEQLHDYMRATSPKLWMILAAVIALLGGFIIYASTATMESVVPVKAEVFETEMEGEVLSSVSIMLPASDKDVIRPGMQVRIAGKTGKVDFIVQDGEEITAIVEMDGENVRLPMGTYDAELVTESTTPISFLLN